MTKERAQQSLNMGRKVTHQLFKSHEYLIRNRCKLYEEDGKLVNENKFWSTREGSEWNAGWSIHPQDNLKFKRRKLY